MLRIVPQNAPYRRRISPESGSENPETLRSQEGQVIVSRLYSTLHQNADEFRVAEFTPE